MVTVGKFLKRYKTSAGLAVLLVLALLALAYQYRYSIQILGENVQLLVDPSAERYFNYGVRHFDSRITNEYNVSRAYGLFLKAKNINPDFPYVNHELARIEFLRGHFALALGFINEEIIRHPKDEPNVYYVRALIRAYDGDYAGAAGDYETYFKITPANWAGINDYSWVLLKAGRAKDALEALDWGLKQWPENAWLLSNKATALYELGHYTEAEKVALIAQGAVEKLTVDVWLNAYPGNDPLIARQGLEQFKTATQTNLEKIRAHK
jgi:tetratricopeptide (TPR) repeat protein